ncbi:MAG: MoaD/ThiS family protein [Bacillota bacterium]|uniref:MoaD/ThiS family protein n=1 Tax=Thermanaerosceptrum fracticalcis TaxID=1712410 RepID=A0A7G6E313_THEFR|nr:MoaD/ThiS family protein [Thermanaerosceptrum fracticalcis]QNB46467.1 hypothetical protein BR63_09165 [Thermanaerosceptrum fracticalcis]
MTDIDRIYLLSYGDIQLIVGTHKKELYIKKNSSFYEFLEYLIEIYGKEIKELIKDPDTGQYLPIMYVINSRVYAQKDLCDVKLKDQDEVAIIYYAEGG